MFIDPQFKSHIPALRDDEKKTLEESLVRDGCRDPLVVWQGTNALLDGHNRYEICRRLNIPFKITKISLPDRDAALAWIEDNQLGRRNLTPNQFAYFVGRKYKRQKKASGGRADRDFSGGKNDHPKTAESIAKEHGLTEKTVRNSAAFADDVDAIADVAGDEVKQKILSGEERMTREIIHELATDRDYLEKYKRLDNDWLEFQKKKDGVLAKKWTGDQESNTPEKYIEAARAVMGSIDLDPASNDFAQKTVKAKKYYTKHTDGLHHPWEGNIFLNPPYSHPEIKFFVDKLLSELKPKQQAILLTNNNTDTEFFHNAAHRSSAICFTRGRINFIKPDGQVSSPTNGQVFFYFGENTEKFIEYFDEFGSISDSWKSKMIASAKRRLAQIQNFLKRRGKTNDK